MKKPLLLSLSALMTLSVMPAAHAQREAPDRGAVRAGRRENRSTGTSLSRGQNRAIAGGGTAQGGGQGGGGMAGGQGGWGGQGGGNNWGGNGQGGQGGDWGQGGQDPAAAMQSRVMALRALMNAAGITDVPTQDPIIAFIFEQERQRKPLLQLAREAIAQINMTAGTQAGGMTAVATNPNAAPGEGNKDAIGDDPGLAKFQEYANALEGDKARYNADLQKLDEKIGYTKKPRLEAFLSLIGVLDNDTYAFGGPPAVFAPGTNQMMQGGMMRGGQGQFNNGQAAPQMQGAQ